MGQVLHGCATTTEAVRRAIQNSQESLRALAKRYGINQKTVAKWKERETVADIPTGPRDAKSTVLSIEEEAIIVAFRRHTLLPLDDCLYALQPTIPHLTRSSLHRCLQRHGISRLPEVEGSKPPKKKFKAYPIGYFHIDIAELQTAEGKLYLYVAIDRTSKFAFVQLVRKTGRTSASAFLEALIAAVPYKTHTVLTDNGIQFTFPPRYADGPTARYVTHMFDMRCQENGIEHRLTKIKHPWTNGQVERMNRTIKEAAKGLDAALRATHARRIHLAPLDLAAELPPLAFGPARVCRMSADKLRGVADSLRLRRLYPRQDFDAERFSEFHWLIVEETVVLEQEPEERAVPVLFMDLSQDLGRIEPHKGRFPTAFEEALFFLLLAPWESWSTMQEVDWRGFRVPWVYTIDSDIFVRPRSPLSPDTLSWEDRVYDDGYGGKYEEERPVELHLEEEAKTELTVWDQSRWATVEQAKGSVLFETPIAHFLVRAFLAEGVDEFLAHITTIEAALGLRADYQKNFRIAPDRHKGMRATNRMRGRVAGLLGDRRSADQYEQLFNMRSAFLHGRAMTAISTKERVMARSLAREVVEALILATLAGPIGSREDFLDGLLDKGAPLI